MPGIKTVFGSANVNPGANYSTAEDIQKLFDTLKQHNVTTLDTAEIYGESEKMLGEYKAGEHFTVDTKIPGGFGAMIGKIRDTAGVVDAAKSAINDRLAMKQVDILYIHSPHENEEPHESTLSAIDQLHKAGLFKRFGLSNYSPKQVQDVYKYCEDKGFVKPSVYQGNYNAVSRAVEETLFPTLRKLGMSFYAYSPTAGGFLAKSKQQVLDKEGRFGKTDMIGQMYTGMYASNDQVLGFLDGWGKIAEELGIPRAELSYRWVKYESALKEENGDGLVIGASSLVQLEQTLDGLDKGPLGADAKSKIDELWEGVKKVAPGDNWQFMLSQGGK